MAQEIVFGCFFATWAVLGVVQYFLFFRGDDAAFKRRWYPRFVIATGLLLAAFIATMKAPMGADPFALAMIGLIPLIAWLNIRNSAFCDKCAGYLFWWSSPPVACPKCGARFDRAGSAGSAARSGGSRG